MRCEEVRPLISAGLDGELEPGAAASLQAHLSGCALCMAERESLSATVRLLRAVPEADPPVELRRRIGVALLEVERRAERRWLGLSWLARPQAAGWAWGAALGTVAATLGLLATRGPVMPRTAGVSSPPPAQVQAPQPGTLPSVRKVAGRKLPPGWGRSRLPGSPRRQ
jgi:anti-sigma factor RsiW